MSNSLDPDQARRFVGPDLGPNCLPRLSVDETGRQRVNVVWLLNPTLLNEACRDKTCLRGFRLHVGPTQNRAVYP